VQTELVSDHALEKLHSWTRRGEPIMLNTSVLKPAGLKQVTSTLLINKKAMMIVSAAPRNRMLHGKWTQIVIITKQLVTADVISCTMRKLSPCCSRKFFSAPNSLLAGRFVMKFSRTALGSRRIISRHNKSRWSDDQKLYWPHLNK
jgi:hypothetical protein